MITIDYIKEKLKDDVLLYHFTTFESSLKILASMSLRFGRLEDMNDVNESVKYYFSKVGSKINYDQAKMCFSKFQQISLSSDFCQGKKN